MLADAIATEGCNRARIMWSSGLQAEARDRRACICWKRKTSAASGCVAENSAANSMSNGMSGEWVNGCASCLACCTCSVVLW